MGAEFTTGMDRRQRSREKLDALVSSRTATLALLTELASRQPFNPEPSMEKALREFCEALIDYTASAHFQLYRYLSDNRFCVLTTNTSRCPWIIVLNSLRLTCPTWVSA